jgi:hypothetical protein
MAKLKIILVLTMFFSMSMTRVWASGDTKEVCVTQYGGATDCHTETINEEVTHGTVNAGLGDNLFVMAGIMVIFGAGLFGLAKLVKRSYWLD